MGRFLMMQSSYHVQTFVVRIYHEGGPTIGRGSPDDDFL